MSENLRFVDNYKTPVDWSINNLSLAKRGSIKAGLHVPFLFEKCYATDKFDVEFASKLQSNALVSPLMGDFTLRFSTFRSNMSNYYGWLDNNERVDADKWLNRRRHYVSVLHNYREGYDYPGVIPCVYSPDGVAFNLSKSDYYKMCVRPGSLLDFIGVPPGFICPALVDAQFATDVESVASLSFPYRIVADRILVYLDTIRNYMVNNQYDSVPYLYCPRDVEDIDNWINTSQLRYVDLKVLDFFFKMLRMEPDGCDLLGLLFTLRDDSAILSKHEIAAYQIQDLINWFENIAYGGLFCAQYPNDMLQNLLQKVGTENVEVIVDPETGSFSIVDFRWKNRIQHVHEDINLSGGRPDDVNQMLWHSKGYGELDIPHLISVSQFDINPQNVVSTSNTQGASGDGSSLGEMASLVNSNDFQNNFNIGCDWDAIIMNIVTLVPKVDYSQGMDKDIDSLLFADDFKPQFNQLGFADIPYYRYNALPQNAPTQLADDEQTFVIDVPGLRDNLFHSVAGKTVAFINMRSNVNRLHGAFSAIGDAQSWVLGRTFREIIDDGSTDLVVREHYNNLKFSPYINPADLQFPFVNTDVNKDNWYLQIGYKIRAVRPISNQARPTLE